MYLKIWKEEKRLKAFFNFMPLRVAGCIMEFHFVNLRAQAPPPYEYRLGDPLGLRGHCVPKIGLTYCQQNNAIFSPRGQQ